MMRGMCCPVWRVIDEVWDATLQRPASGMRTSLLSRSVNEVDRKSAIR